MFFYREEVPDNVKQMLPNPHAAHWLLPLIEHSLSLSLGLFMMRHTMVFPEARALLTRLGIGTLNQFETFCMAFEALLKNACAEDLIDAGLRAHYARHTAGIFCNTMSMHITGDPLSDLSLAAAYAQRGRVLCENALRVADDSVEEVIATALAQQCEMVESVEHTLAELREKTHKYGLCGCNAAFDVCCAQTENHD